MIISAVDASLFNPSERGVYSVSLKARHAPSLRATQPSFMCDLRTAIPTKGPQTSIFS